jgi:hypothetical protein
MSSSSSIDCRFSTTSRGAPVRIEKSISSSLVAGQGASLRYEASSKVQYIVFVFFAKIDFYPNYATNLRI